MQDMGIMWGDREAAQTAFEICIDTVMLRLNPRRVPPFDGDGGAEIWEFRGIQYELHEWLKIVTECVIDTASFALAEDLAEELEARTVDLQEVRRSLDTEAFGVMAVTDAYIGLPCQKPFTFKTKFTQRKG